MKMKLNNAAFKPVVLEITFETAEELKAMQLVSTYAESVVESIYSADIDVDQELIYRMLNNIWEQLKGIK